MKYFKGLIAVSVLLSMMFGFAWADPPPACEGTNESPCIVQDSLSRHAAVQHLRHIATIAESYSGTTLGIYEMFLSGSEQPSERGWKFIAKFIRLHKPKTEDPVVILDLRQESHGYLNGKAMTLVSTYNWLNFEKTNEDSVFAQGQWLHSLSNKKIIDHVLTVKQYRNKEFSNGKSMVIGSVKEEEYYVKQWGFEYHRLFITDHRRPSDAEVDVFLDLVRNKPRNTWYHVHCRGGKGRTSTILALFDMLNNADKVSFEEIIARQASIPPYYNLMNVDGNPELTPYYMARIAFLRQFYDYARQCLQGYSGTWSEWHQLNA